MAESSESNMGLLLGCGCLFVVLLGLVGLGLLIWRLVKRKAPSPVVNQASAEPEEDPFEVKRFWPWELAVDERAERVFLEALRDLSQEMPLYLQPENGLVKFYEPPQVVSLLRMIQDFARQHQPETPKLKAMLALHALVQEYSRNESPGVLHLTKAWVGGESFEGLDRDALLSPAMDALSWNPGFSSDTGFGSTTLDENSGEYTVELMRETPEIQALYQSDWKKGYALRKRDGNMLVFCMRRMMEKVRALRPLVPEIPLKQVMAKALLDMAELNEGLLWASIEPKPEERERLITMLRTPLPSEG
jgi:hypothetical protein